MGHFRAIAGPVSVVQEEDFSWVQAEAIAKMMEEIAGDTDRRGSDGTRVDEEHGHSTGWAITALLFEEGLHLVEEAVAVFFHRHAAFFGEFLEQFFLASGQFGGNLNLNDK